jgi:hypothetical protein
VSVRLAVAALPVVPERVPVPVAVADSLVVPVAVAVSLVVPVVAAVVPVDPVAVVAHRVPSAAAVDVRFADASPSGRSVRSSSRCRPRHSAVSRFPAATARPSSGCVVVPR